MPIITGKHGVIKLGYQSAITIRDWYLKSEQEVIGKYSSTLRGKIVSLHSIWAKQTPLTMELCLGHSYWVWDDVTLLNPQDLKVGGDVELYTESNPSIK